MDRASVHNALVSANKVVLVCGREKSGKSSMVELLSGAYCADIHHEYTSSSYKKAKNLRIKCTTITFARRRDEFIHHQKICFCELTAMDKLAFQDELSFIIRTCIPEPGSKAQTDVCGKICAILYVVKDNLLSKDVQALNYHLFEMIKNEAYRNDKNNSSGSIGDDNYASFIQCEIKKILNLERRMVYAAESNNLQYLSAHISLKKVPLCLVINKSYDVNSIILKELCDQYLQNKTRLFDVIGTKMRMEKLKDTSKGVGAGAGLVGTGLLPTIEEGKSWDGSDIKLINGCDIASRIMLKVYTKGMYFVTLNEWLSLGLVEEMKKEGTSTREERKSIILRLNIVSNAALVPSRTLVKFLPTSHNSYGISTVDDPIKPNSLRNYAENRKDQDTMFVCRCSWGNEKEQDSTDSVDVDKDEILQRVIDMEKVTNFFEFLSNGIKINESIDSPFTSIIFWLMRCSRSANSSSRTG